jgi:hypothetical protein
MLDGTTTQSSTEDVIVIPMRMTVRKEQNPDAFGNPVYQAQVSNPTVECNEAPLYKFVWTIVGDGLDTSETPVFDNFPIVFANPAAPRLVVPFRSASDDHTTFTMYWSNAGSERDTFRYTLRAHVGPFSVTHDPTVENIPPGT